MDKKEKDRYLHIMQRLHEHLKYLLDKGYDVVYLGWQGSQNYDLDVYDDDYKSDIDTKAIVLPSFEDFVYNRTPISVTEILPNNEHIDVKDVRVMFETFKKQNINFIEILFTQFGIVMSEYEKIIQPLFDNKEKIARLNYNQALKCMAGMSKEKLKALQHPYPSIIEKIEKYGYDGKQLHHILRMNDFMRQYVNGHSYECCLKPKIFTKNSLLKAKKNEISCEVAIKIAQSIDADTYNLKEKHLKSYETVDIEAIKILDNVKYNLLKYKFKKELINIDKK